MPQPDSQEVHVDQILTNISVAYVQNATNFVSANVFPVVPVAKQSDKYYSYTKAFWFSNNAQRRGDAEEAAHGGYGLTTASYYCDVYAMGHYVGDQTRANQDSPLDLDRSGAEWVTQQLMQKLEQDWMSTFFTTSVWGTSATPSTLWDSFAGSDPISDIEVARRTILANTGMEPNTLVMDYRVWEKVKQHPDIIDRLKYTSADSVSTATFARLLELDRVFVIKSVKNSANENATASYGFTSGKHALLCYSPPNPGLLQPAAGYTFMWNGISGGLGANVAISRIRDDLKRADKIEGQIAYDQKIVSSDLGYFFDGAVA